MGWQKKEGSQGCSGPLRAHLWLLLLAQLPEQGDLLLVPGHDTQDLVPAGRQRGHREGTGLEGSWENSTPAQRVGKCINWGC